MQPQVLLVLVTFLYEFCHSINEDSASSLLMLAQTFPQYIPVSPCACDLTPQKCDTYCCCDQDCPEGAERNGCIEGEFGGEPHEEIALEKCTNSTDRRIDANPGNKLLCVSGEHSNYLGSFFAGSSVISSPLVYSLSKEGKKTFKTFQSNTPISTSSPTSYIGYRAGNAIRVSYNKKEGISGTLNLPQSSSSSLCLTSAPVRFLRDSASTCTVKLDKDRCNRQASPSLSHLSYLQGKGPNVLAHGATRPIDPTAKTEVPVDVNYFATDAGYKYVKRYPTKRGTNSNYDYDGEEIDGDDILEQLSQTEGDVGKFHQDQDELDYSIVKFVGEPPELNLDGETCANAVAEVHYSIVWEGTSVIKVKADILLVNVSTAEDETVQGQDMRQFFSVKFTHASRDNMTIEEKARTSQLGYNIGDDLKTGSITKGDQFKTAHLSFWRPDTSSLCRHARLEKAKFGEDVDSGCLLRLDNSNFTDCDELNEYVENIFRTMLDASSIAKGGSQIGDGNNFVKVIFENDKVETNNSTENETDSTQDENKVVVPFLQCNVSNIRTLQVTYSRADVPSDKPVFRINGAMVKRGNSLWSLPKKGTNQKMPKTADFELKLSFRFEDIPLRWKHQNDSRFWYGQHSTRCEGDVCWKELAFAFTSAESGWDISYVTQWFLILTGLAAVVLFLTRAYW